jgi:hypothetical protein
MNRQKILIALTVLFALVVFWLISVKNSLQQEITTNLEKLEDIKKEGIVLSDLKNRWENKTKLNKDLSKLVNFRSNRPQKRERNNKIILTFFKLSKRNLDSILKKVLMTNLTFLNIEVNRIDDYTADLKVEIKK